MSPKTIDLHTHTSRSDGKLSPIELVRKAHNLKISALAITDHDTIDGVHEAQCAAQEHGIEIIPGVELSAHYGLGTLHILGYFVDITHPTLLHSLQEYRHFRDRRNPLILHRLRELGYPLDMEEVTRHAGGNVINRPHIAQAMLNRGYVKNCKEAFDRFLGQGAAAYFAKEVYDAPKAVQIIHESGGLAVMAHPALLHDKGLVKIGHEIRRLHAIAHFDGIEAYHGDCISDHSDFFVAIARELNLFVTGGSDFHGDETHFMLGQTRFLSSIPYQLIDKMRNALLERNTKI